MNDTHLRQDAGFSSTRVPLALGAIWLLATWWLSSQYLGHSLRDGLLYSAEALRRLEPGNFTRDPFFIGQSQGNFSLFGLLYAQVLAALGSIQAAGLLMATLGRLFWGLASWHLARRLWPEQPLAALLLLLLLPASYDSMGMFAFGESEVTSRCWAEACVLMALGQHLNHRRWQPWLWLLLAATLHPLMALPGLGLLALLQPARIRYALLAGGISLSLAAAAAGLGPFAQLFATFDDLWWHQVVLVTGYVLPQAWAPHTLIKTITCWAVLLAWVGWRHPQRQIQHLARALLVVMAAMLALWWWASVSRNVLLTQLQLWRVLWLCQLLAPALWLGTLPPWREWDTRLWIHVLLVSAAVLAITKTTVWLTIPAMLLLLPQVAGLWRSVLLRRVMVLMALLLLGMTLMVRYPAFEYQKNANILNELVLPRFVAAAAEPFIALPASLLVLWLLTRSRRPWQLAGLAAVIAAPVLACGYVLAGQWQKASTPLPSGAALQAHIPPGSLVYWDQGVSRTWFTLHRAHYAGPNQGATSLFSREAALAFKHRFELLEQSGLEASLLAPQEETRSIGMNSIRTVCSDASLDFVLISQPLAEADAQVPYAGATGGMVSLFRCAAHR